MYILHKTSEFDDWMEEQPLKSRLQIENRLMMIACDGHFGNSKRLTDHLYELKWTNGRRLYYAYIAELDILLLLGGNKNGQSKDITQAQKILERYTQVET